MRPFLAAPALLLVLLAPLRGAGENVAKQVVRIPMRDGVELCTVLYLPRTVPGPHPLLLERTPYSAGPYGPRDFSRLDGMDPYLRDGYVLAFQDVRGRFRSGGTFMHVRPMRGPGQAGAVDEGTDAWDTVEWLLKHLPDLNGKVGLRGLSYGGFYAAAGLVGSHPSLRAVSPQAPIMDWFMGDDDHRNGALCLDMIDFYAGFFGPETNQPTDSPAPPFAMGTPDGYRFFLELGPVRNLQRLDARNQSPFLKEALAHPDYDAFWQARNLRPHLRDVRPAVLTVGGWYDGEDLFGALECDKALERQSPATERHLVMGPWSHGQWASGEARGLGQARWGQATGPWFRDRIEKPFFDHHLLGRQDPALPRATAFDGGSRRWRSFDAWPPARTRSVSFHFRADGRLAPDQPPVQTPVLTPAPPPTLPSAFDTFVSDPAHPVPFTSGIAPTHSDTYLVEDQRFAATRPDVLVYESDPLPEDLTAAGPVLADLLVSTTGTDADWVVKVIDVHPGDEPDPVPNPRGYRNGHWQELVRADVMRGRYRDGFEHPAPFVPGRPTRVSWPMNGILHTFRRGHRIMVQVQCSWFPLVDRNPQTFVDINTAGPEAFVAATQRVYRGGPSGSRIELGVLEDGP